jgi:hypothetical protein
MGYDITNLAISITVALFCALAWLPYTCTAGIFVVALQLLRWRRKLASSLQA